MDKTKIENKMVTYVNTAAIDVHGIKAGQEFEVEVDREGTPLDLHTRRRVKDGCFKKKTKKSGGNK